MEVKLKHSKTKIFKHRQKYMIATFLIYLKYISNETQTCKFLR